jgi:hypothetical protein
MKKILLLTALVFTVAISKAQYEETSNFKLGLTAHPTLGWIKSDVQNVKNDGMRMGFSYGLIGDFLFADSYAFSTGLMLSTINGQTESTAGTTINKNVYKLQYLEIPAKIKLLTKDINGIKYFGEFGLGNGFKVRAKQDVKSNVAAEVRDNEDIGSRIGFYRGSIIIGGGAEIATSGRTRILAGLTFDNGFTDIQKGSGTLKNSYIGLNFGVFF